jgi:SAM-dependent methyltransferase
VPAGIDWCRQTITPRFPNFRFQLADIYNAHYHPAGTLTAAEYHFPYPDAAFDFAFATSVFTHMFPRDVERYLTELARVLRPGGRCLLTFFLLNARSLPPVEAGTAQQDFRHRGDGYRTAQPDQPEAAIAYDEGAIRALCMASGLRIVEPIRFGSWSGRRGGYSYQDIIIAVK